jgi:hypothetical protein
MVKHPVVRRIADAFFALITWAAASVAVMWCYDWVSRWYIVVVVLLTIVAGASFGDRLKAKRAEARAAVGVLPLQREPEAAESWVEAEQQIA